MVFNKVLFLVESIFGICLEIVLVPVELWFVMAVLGLLPVSR